MHYTCSLSYTKAVNRRVRKAETELSYFTGSSKNRKNGGAKKIQSVEAPQVAAEAASKNIFDAQASPKPLHGILTDKDTKPADSAEPKYRTLSRRSRGKIRDKIFSMYGACPADEFTFLTLTFIAAAGDQMAQKCLNKFLTELRRRFGRFMYVWVAERQGNGNIHFHFICNRRFPIKEINALWVVQQYAAGIEHEKYTMQQIRDFQASGIVQQKLSPVWIRPVKSVRKLSGYLTEYVSKNVSVFECAVWHCCRGVSSHFTAQQVEDSVFFEAQNPEVNFTYSKKTGEVFECKTSVVANPETGETIALVTTLLNKEYFRKHLVEMDEANRIMTVLYLKKIKPPPAFYVNLRLGLTENILQILN